MRRSCVIAVSLLVLGLTARMERTSGDEPAQGQRGPNIEFVGKDFNGRVTSVTKDSITLERSEIRRELHHRRRNADGSITEWAEREVIPAVPPKKFAASETLAAGKVPTNPRPQPNPLPHQPRWTYHVGYAEMYRLSDVKVGDSVSILYSRIDGVDTCDHIQITKRPGGRVPPLPEEAEALRKPTAPQLRALYIPYHEEMNAFWDWKDDNITYPAKFGKDRRFGVAPMPREVKRPAISP